MSLAFLASKSLSLVSRLAFASVSFAFASVSFAFASVSFACASSRTLGVFLRSSRFWTNLANLAFSSANLAFKVSTFWEANLALYFNSSRRLFSALSSSLALVWACSFLTKFALASASACSLALISVALRLSILSRRSLADFTSSNAVA